MDRLMIALLCVPVLLVAAAGCETTPKDNPDEAMAPASVTIHQHLHGDISGIDAPGVYHITSREQLDAFGSATLAAVRIDFQTQALVLLTLGQQPTGGYWCRINAVERVGPMLLVKGQANRPGPDEIVTQVLTTPYCVAVIDRTDATDLRSDITSLTGQPAPE